MIIFGHFFPLLKIIYLNCSLNILKALYSLLANKRITTNLNKGLHEKLHIEEVILQNRKTTMTCTKSPHMRHGDFNFFPPLIQRGFYLTPQ